MIRLLCFYAFVIWWCRWFLKNRCGNCGEVCSAMEADMLFGYSCYDCEDVEVIRRQIAAPIEPEDTKEEG